MKRGVHAILYAFFRPDETLDRAAMRRQVELCLTADVAGIAALGLATEVAGQAVTGPTPGNVSSSASGDKTVFTF